MRDPDASGPEAVVRRHCLIEGRVQGVGFRWFTARQGGRLGLQGWVRNLPGGQVEVLVQGRVDRIDEFVALMRRGPVTAEVSNLQVREEAVSGKLPSFSSIG